MKKSSLGRFAPALWIVAAWIGAWVTSGHYTRHGSAWTHLFRFLDRFSLRAFSGFPSAQQHAANVLQIIHSFTSPTFGAFGWWATFLVPLGFVARMAARARVRSGASDPLDRLRAWTGAHPIAARVVLAVLPLLWGIGTYARLVQYHDEYSLAEILPVAFASVLAQFVAARATVRAFVSPTVDPEEETRIEIGPDEIAFDAVAVTREARAAVGALAALSLGMVVWLAALPIAVLFRDPRLFTAVAVYMAIAALSATVFRAASRVAVGVDGVLVKGTSRTRFYAYRDIDGARVASGDLELLRRGKVILRLQLHGADAIRRDAVTARIRENVERVQRGEHAVTAQLVASSSKDQLTRVASGGADYRAASLSREALWALIEGPTVDSESRRAAAEALSKTSDDSERARLRVAAEHCADPQVRIALTELAEAIPEAHRAERGAGATLSRGA